MAAYISMLRGINVGGHKKIDMKGLKSLYEDIGFKDVLTYIQSGNIIFRTELQTPDQILAENIEKTIFKKYRFEVPVIIRSLEEINRSIKVNPFIKKSSFLVEKLHITFLGKEPLASDWEIIKGLDRSPDEFTRVGKEIYLYCPNGYGITKLSNSFFEAKLKVKATTRNWNTVNKLQELAKGIA
jgi:uncharacterized protein (DUF1697 family)